MYFLQESDRKSISCKNIFSVRFLQEMYFREESCKICNFCHDLAGILQELFLFSTREVKSVGEPLQLWYHIKIWQTFEKNAVP